MNEDTFRREKLVYSATPNSGSDLVTGKGSELTKADIWERITGLLDIGHWATNRQLQIWVRGFYTKRYSTIEEVYAQKVKRGDLREDHYGKPKVYAKPIRTRGGQRRHRPYLYHELSCMECYIRFQKSKKGKGIPGKGFEGLGVLPDFSIEYDKSILIGEFETEGDIEHHKRLEGKIVAYHRYLDDIQEEFGRIPVVVFILDIPRDSVRKWVRDLKPDGRIYFCDYQTLKQKELTEALRSSIYIWRDGEEYALK